MSYSIIYADPPWKYKTYSDRNVCPYPIMKDNGKPKSYVNRKRYYKLGYIKSYNYV